jgi:hypothetical protein
LYLGLWCITAHLARDANAVGRERSRYVAVVPAFRLAMLNWVQCDQERPSCHRCRDKRESCPGYRDLSKVVFRDEVKRIVGLHQRGRLRSSGHGDPLMNKSDPCVVDGLTSQFPELGMPVRLDQPWDEAGANFFFARYAFHDPPAYKDYYTWLSQGYFSGCGVLTAAVEAVGMAGLANIRNDESLATQADERCAKAMRRLQQALVDPVERSADETMMAVLLLALFEVHTWSSPEPIRTDDVVD